MVLQTIEVFARGAQTSAGVLQNTDLANEIIEFYEPERILYKLCADRPISGLSTIVPKAVSDINEMAVEVAEMSAIPMFHTQRTAIPIMLMKNATHYFISQEAGMVDAFDSVYEDEAKAAGLRMARKEDYDIAQILAGSFESQSATTSNELNAYDVSLAKATLKTRGYQADTLVLNPVQFADIEAESVVRNIEYTSEQAKVQGYTFPTFMGLRIFESNKVTAGNAFVMDVKSQPIYFYYNKKTTTDTYNVPGRGEGCVITAYHKPYLIRRDAIQKITGC